MKQSLLIIAAAFLLLPYWATAARKMEGKKSMFITLSKSTFFLGEPIPVEITYENSSTTETLSMESPSKSLNVIMHVVDSKNKEDSYYAMGKIIVTVIDKSSDRYALGEPAVEKIKISPKSEYRFISDLNDRLYLHPGDFVCYLSDSKDESNRIKINIRFTHDSVDYLLKLAQNKEASYGRREWAMEWLQKLYPDFKLYLPLEDDADDIKSQKETYNKGFYDTFLKWWHDNRDKVHLDEMLK